MIPWWVEGHRRNGSGMRIIDSICYIIADEHEKCWNGIHLEHRSLDTSKDSKTSTVSCSRDLSNCKLYSDLLDVAKKERKMSQREVKDRGDADEQIRFHFFRFSIFNWPRWINIEKLISCHCVTSTLYYCIECASPVTRNDEFGC